MKPGDEVKILVDQDWRHAELIRQVKDGWKVKSNFKEFVFKGQIKKFERISEKKLKEHGDRLPLVKELIDQALETLVPGEGTEILGEEIYGYGRCLSLSPNVTEKETIGSFREVPVWEVVGWKFYGPTRHESGGVEAGGVEECHIGNCFSDADAAQRFVLELFKLKNQDYWENKADEAMAKQFEEVEF